MPRTILITGCSSPRGIGFATARALARAGNRVVATVRDHSHDDELLDGIDGLSISTMDVLDSPSVVAAVSLATKELGGIDVLINNAGYGLIGGIEQSTDAQARAQFDTNYFGTLEVIRRVLPVMRTQRTGLILAVSTIFSPTLSPPAIGHYIASKSALEAAMQSLAAEVAVFGIQVGVIQPGPVNTELSRIWAHPHGDPNPQLVDDLYAWIDSEPGIVMEEPVDVAAAIVALVNGDAPSPAVQTSTTATAWVARALTDPSRFAERAELPWWSSASVRTTRGVSSVST